MPVLKFVNGHFEISPKTLFVLGLVSHDVEIFSNWELCPLQRLEMTEHSEPSCCESHTLLCGVD